MRTLAQAAGWLTFSAGMIIIYLSFVLFDFFPASAGGVRIQIYFLNFVGTLLGALICPLFLPLPETGREPVPGKKPWVSAVFIFLAILPNIVIRSFGVGFWLNSFPARCVLAVDSGLFYAIGYGLFFLTQLRNGTDSGENRTSRFCSFLMGVSIMSAVLIRLGALSLLKRTGLASDPLRVMNLLFKILQWMSLSLGVSASVCVGAFSKTIPKSDTDAFAFPAENPASQAEKSAFRAENLKASKTAIDTSTFLRENLKAQKNYTCQAEKSDWAMIARLTGLSVTFTLLNSLLEMRLFPLVSGVVGAYEPFFPIVVPAVLLLCWIVGRSRMFIRGTAGGFLRFLLISMMFFFILLPNLHFSKEYPFATLVMNSLVSIFHFSMWVILSAAVVELYRGRRWFYLCAVAVYMMHSVSFFGPLFGRFIPEGGAFTVLITATSAVVFVLLGFRTLFPSLWLPEKFFLEPAVAAVPGDSANARDASSAEPKPPAPASPADAPPSPTEPRSSAASADPERTAVSGDSAEADNPAREDSAADPSAEAWEAIFREQNLTDREAEVARLILEGLSNREIADRLSRATVTVEKHITAIYRKFGIDDKTSGRAAFMALFIKPQNREA